MSLLHALQAPHTLTVSSEAIPLVFGQPALEPVRLSGREGVNGLFEYELLLKTPDSLNLGATDAANFDLDSFIGREVCCRIELDGTGSFVPGAPGAASGGLGAGVREINALVPGCSFVLQGHPRDKANAEYTNVPTNGFAQYYRSSASVRAKLDKKSFDKPALLVVAEHDSVVNVSYAFEVFTSRFTHPASRLVWYGALPKGRPASPRVLVRSDAIPAERISQFSHMGVLFSPRNALYGRAGSQPLCRNGQNEADYAKCLAGAEVWYADWGYEEPAKIHARLTFNPYFEWQTQVMNEVAQAASKR
jgi:hypothetical protein